MIIKQVRLSQQAKDQLSRLKGKTGIKNWNILCRWALCYSLAEKTLPTDIPLASDSTGIFSGMLRKERSWIRRFFMRNIFARILNPSMFRIISKKSVSST